MATEMVRGNRCHRMARKLQNLVREIERAPRDPSDPLL